MSYYLIATKARSHSISQPVCLTAFREVKNGFNWSVKREMNHPRAANRPVKYCTPFPVVGF